MCGIAGKVHIDEPVPPGLVERMCAAQEHRGPDSRGVHLDEGVGLGVQRLRVIDLETGDQPIYNEDRSIAVVFNGELYNHRELREELAAEGHTFSTRGDTEVLVHLYEELGSELVRRLNGMFAFALWDARRRRLLLARDRVGKKPLFYAEDPSSLSFASELGALMVDREIPREIDPSSLDCFLAYGYIPAPYSVWRKVRKLPPAHTLTWEGGRSTLRRYWRLDYTGADSELADLEDGLRARVAAAVRRRMIADVPLGAFLSGGVDSSIVVSEMAVQAGEPVKTFSIGFDREEYSELPRARLIAKRFRTDHTEFVVRPDAIELLPKMVRHYGEPYADSSAIPSFYLAELTRRQVTVALNGDGGDESFAGYRRHTANAMTGWIDHMPRRLRAGAAALALRAPQAGERRAARTYATRFLAAAAADAPARYAAHVGIFDAAARKRVLAPDVLETVDPTRAADVIRRPWEAATGGSRLDVVLQTDVQTYLPGDLLTKMDIATMASSLEARSPLLDHELMEFAASIPARYKARLGKKKWLLRRAYRGRLPAEILDGPKRGFAVPIGAWLRGELREWARETLLDREARESALIESSEVGKLLDEHQAGRRDLSHQIWALLCLETWRREIAAG
jgi:asparagine synthase (glutamine-hydrolysing)